MEGSFSSGFQLVTDIAKFTKHVDIFQIKIDKTKRSGGAVYEKGFRTTYYSAERKIQFVGFVNRDAKSHVFLNFALSNAFDPACLGMRARKLH